MTNSAVLGMPEHASDDGFSAYPARDVDAVISGSNPLVAAANPLLDLIPQIRATASHTSPAMLREHLVDEIRHFEMRAQRAGIANETILGARYCLCTALDESVALTPWGGNGVWSAHSLLVTFHNETWGGEKFFQLLSRLSQNAEAHIDLLELLYYCLVLGFEGRYRVLDNGRAQLDTLRQRLLIIIRKQRGQYADELSPHWRDTPAQEHGRRLPVPLWAALTLAAALLLLAYFVFSWVLGGRSDPVFAGIGQISTPTLQVMPQRTEPAKANPRLAVFLEPEIKDGLLMVNDAVDRSVVVLRGDGLFQSGAVEVNTDYRLVLERVAAALESVPGEIIVDGYTDNIPMRSVRFPSNWHLSQARAEAVAGQLAQRLSNPRRVRAQGRGEANPLASNNTAEGRARNRRVEISVITPTSRSAAERGAVQ